MKIVGFILILLLIGCQSEKVQRTVHEGAIDDSKSVVKSNENDVPEETNSQIDSKSVFNENFFSDRKNAESETFLTFNRNLSKALTQSPLTQEIIDNSKWYLEKVHSGCQPDLTDCHNNLFFKRNTYSALIVAQILDKRLEIFGGEIPVAKYYTYLRLAKSFKAFQAVQLIHSLYLERAEELTQLNKKNEEESPFRQKQHLTQIEISLTSLNKSEEKEASAAIRRFLGDIKVWDLSDREAHSYLPIHSTLMDAASQYDLYSLGSSGELSESLIQAIGEQKIVFMRKVEMIRRQFSEGAPSLYLLNLNQFNEKYFDEYFYLAEVVMEGKLRPEKINRIWANTKREEANLKEKIQNKIRLEFLSLALRFNKKIQKRYLYLDAQSLEKAPGLLFKETMDTARALMSDWVSFRNRARNIVTFAKENFKRGSIEIENIVGRLDDEIQLLVSIPNQLMMMNIFAGTSDNMTKEEKRTMTAREAQLDQAVIAASIASGTPNWFGYGNTGFIGEKWDFLFSLSKAMKLNLIPLKDEKAKSDVIRLTTNLLKWVIDDRIPRRKMFVVKIDEHLADKETSEMYDLCEVIPDNFLDLDKSELKNLLKKLTVNTDFTTLHRSTLFADPKMFEDMLNLHHSTADDSAVNSIRDIRTTENGLMIFLESWLDIVSKEIRKKGMEPNIELKEVFQSFKDYRRTTYSSVAYYIDEYRRINSCYQKIVNLQNFQQHWIVELEREHLGTVYDLFHSSQGEASEYIASFSDPSVSIFGEEIKKASPRMSISSTSYSYTKYDFPIRIASFLKVLHKEVEGLSQTKARQLQDSSFYDDSDRFKLRFDMSREDFINKGIKNFFSAFVSWDHERSMHYYSNLALNQAYVLGAFENHYHCPMEAEEDFDENAICIKSKNITAQEIIDSTFHRIDTLHLYSGLEPGEIDSHFPAPEQLISNLLMLGQDRYLPKDDFYGLFDNFNIPKPYLEEPFAKLYNIDLSSGGVSKTLAATKISFGKSYLRNSPIDDVMKMKSYFESQKAGKLSVVDQETFDLLKLKYNKIIKILFEQIQNFYAAVQEREQLSPEGDGFPFRFEVSRGSNKVYQLPRDGTQFIYLGKDVVQSYSRKGAELHKDIGSFLQLKKADLDVIPRSE